MTYWGLPDGGWLNAPTGLVRLDGSTKPAYDALLGLVKGEWWRPPTPMMTAAEGRLSFNGFLGKYELAAGEGSASFKLDRKGPVGVEVGLPG